MGIGHARGRLHLLLCRPGLAVGDVLRDGAVEEHRLLPHQANVLAQPPQLKPAEIGAIQEHGAAIRVVEALEELHGRGLARAAAAHEGHGLPRLDGEREVRVHGGVAAHGIGELDVAELHAAGEGLGGDDPRVREGVDGRCSRHDGLHLARCCARLCEGGQALHEQAEALRAHLHAEDGEHHAPRGDGTRALIRAVIRPARALGRYLEARVQDTHGEGEVARAIDAAERQPAAPAGGDARRLRGLKEGVEARHLLVLGCEARDRAHVGKHLRAHRACG
mmetsp:Transcript_23657/g.64158  ORF Transcript_23657/g.64158 Transcript_23657/m.64158 type:complete len:278 (-) Transcript_23657:3842-4675(-)